MPIFRFFPCQAAVWEVSRERPSLRGRRLTLPRKVCGCLVIVWFYKPPELCYLTF